MYIHQLKKEMTTHLSVLAWRIPWTERSSVNNGIHVSFSTLVSSGYMPRNGIAGSYGGKTLFYVCFHLKMPYLIYTGD